MWKDSSSVQFSLDNSGKFIKCPLMFQYFNFQRIDIQYRKRVKFSIDKSNCLNQSSQQFPKIFSPFSHMKLYLLFSRNCNHKVSTKLSSWLTILLTWLQSFGSNRKDVKWRPFQTFPFCRARDMGAGCEKQAEGIENYVEHIWRMGADIIKTIRINVTTRTCSEKAEKKVGGEKWNFPSIWEVVFLLISNDPNLCISLALCRIKCWESVILYAFEASDIVRLKLFGRAAAKQKRTT